MAHTSPRITIQNLDTGQWLVRTEMKVGPDEHIDVQLMLPRSDVPVGRLQAELLKRAIAHLQAVADSSG